MKRRGFLGLIGASGVTVVACRTLEIEAGLYRPPELTATAEAGTVQPTPTPKPQLGKLAFIHGGDVWVKELPDGQATRLTHDGRNSAPRWSASGEWLAFHKDEQLWVIHATGADAKSLASVKPVEGHDAAWSPVEDRIAYVADDGFFTASPEYLDARLRQLDLCQIVATRAEEGIAIAAFAWSPDGQWLAFEKLEQRRREPPRAQGVWHVRADGSDVRSVYLSPDPARVQYKLAGWSPDGEWILFWEQVPTSSALLADGSPLLAVPAVGGAPVEIARAMLTHRDFLAWAPNGRALAVVDGSGRETWKDKAIAVTTATGGRQRLSGDDRADLFASFSPDGRSIAFASAAALRFTWSGGAEQGAIAERRIWRMNGDGSARRQLTNSPDARDERPRWSLDGAYILFARIQDERGQIWLMRSDGSDQRQMVDELTPSPGWLGSFGYLDWSQLYDWWPGQRPVSQTASPVGLVSWPPITPSAVPSPTPVLADLSGQRIAFVGQDDVRGFFSGHSNLWVMRLDGGPPLKVAERDDPFLHPAAWSPDGERLLVVDDADLVDLDLSTGGRRVLYTVPRPSNFGIGAVFPAPDGRTIAFTLACCMGPGTLHLLPIDGGAPTKVDAELGTLHGWEAATGRLIFVKDGALRAFDPATGQTATLRNLPDHVDPWLTLSPDGRRALQIVFPEKNDGESVRRSDLVVVDLASGESRNLTNGFVHSVRDPGWSADGEWIAFTTSPEWTSSAVPMPRRDLWIMRADGSDKQNVTQGRFDSVTQAIWAPMAHAHSGRGFGGVPQESPCPGLEWGCSAFANTTW